MKLNKESTLFGVMLFAGITILLNINLDAQKPQKQFTSGTQKKQWTILEPIKTAFYPRYSWEDSLEKMYWEIANKTDNTILVYSDQYKVRIEPKHRAYLPREKSFQFTVETESGRRRNFQTKNHFVDIFVGRDPWRFGRTSVRMRSYIEWPGIGHHMQMNIGPEGINIDS